VVELDNIDGLSVEQAVALCVRRHNELKGDELAFVKRIADRREKGTRQRAGLVRLTGIVRRLRQEDLIASVQRER